MHAAAFAFVEWAIRTQPPPPGATIEIGGRNINGTIRGLFPEPYVSLDVAPGPGVDVVADGALWRPAAPAACVVCCEVLEHTPAAEAILANARAFLLPGGVLIVTTAGRRRAPHSALDGGPLRAGEYYRNLTGEALQAWLSGFRGALTRDTGADVYAIGIK